MLSNSCKGDSSPESYYMIELLYLFNFSRKISLIILELD